MEKQSWMDRLNNQEFLSGVIALVIFGLIKILSMRLPAKVSGYPIVMSNVAFVLAVIFFLRCVYRLVKGTLAPKKMFTGDTKGYARYWLTLVLLVVYVAAFSTVGFVVSTFLFIWGVWPLPSHRSILS